MFLLKKKLMILTGLEISLAGVGRGLPLLQLTMTASLKKILELYLFSLMQDYLGISQILSNSNWAKCCNFVQMTLPSEEAI